MNAESKCRECGATIPAESRGGFCPQCLLNLGLQEAAPPSDAESSAPASSASSATEKPGDWIGRYRLLQEIGHGGCGVVYMAEQEQPVRRKVALKVIKLGMDTKQVVARFDAERQALALMDHPNIAKILDAGITESPLPVSDHPLPVGRGEGQREGSGGYHRPSDGRGAGGEGNATRHSSLVTSAGRPYFVMELVGGIKITDYAMRTISPLANA